MSKMQIGIAGVCSVLMLFGIAVAQQPKKPATEQKTQDHKAHNQAMMACAQACSDCQRACDMCSSHCAHQLEHGKKDHIVTLMSCQDCADICAAASQIVSRGGPFSATICEACEKACGDCAKQCEKFPDDEHMKQCAAECRKCEKSCKEMSKHDH